MRSATTVMLVCAWALTAGCNFKTEACKSGEAKLVTPAKAALALLSPLAKGELPSKAVCDQAAGLVGSFDQYWRASNKYIFSHYAKVTCTKWSDLPSDPPAKKRCWDNPSFGGITCDDGDGNGTSDYTCKTDPNDSNHSWCDGAGGSSSSGVECRESSSDGLQCEPASSGGVSMCMQQKVTVTDPTGYKLAGALDVALEDVAQGAALCNLLDYNPDGSQTAYHLQLLDLLRQGLQETIDAYPAYQSGLCR